MLGRRRYQAIAYASPPPGPLPADRTKAGNPFEVTGCDFTGPLKYGIQPKVEGKAYLVLYASSLSRALYLEVLPSLETSEFLSSLKRFIARRGRRAVIYSDNERTFVGAAQWLKQVRRDENLRACLAHQNIKWKFNLSRAPW